MGVYIKRTCLGKHTQINSPTKELLKQQFMVMMVPNGQNHQETAQLELKHKNSFNTCHPMELPKSPMVDKFLWKTRCWWYHCCKEWKSSCCWCLRPKLTTW